MGGTDDDKWWTMGHAARRRGELEEAYDAYAQAAEAARQGHQPEREIEARLYAADCARRLERRGESESQLHAGVEVGRRRGLNGLLARALGELGSLAVAAGDVRVGAAWYREALELAQSVGNVRATATQLGNLGLLALQRGDHDTARDLLRQRLDMVLELRAVDAAADTLTTLAEVEISCGNHQEAEQALHRSLSLRKGQRTVAGVRGIACALVLLARLTREQGRHEEAMGLAERALRAAEAAHAPREEAHAHLQLGHIATTQGDREGAKRYFERAAEGLHGTGDVLQALVADVALASLAVDEGEYETARDTYARTAQGFREHQNPAAAIDAAQLAAQLDAKLGHLVDAEASLRATLQEAEELGYDAAIARIEVNLASAQVAAGNTEAGVAGCLSGARRFETLGRMGDQMMALLGAGEALVVTGRLADADTIFSECCALLEGTGDERATRAVEAWQRHVRLLRDGHEEDARKLTDLCDALEEAGDIAMALRHRLVVATRPGADPALARQVAERAEAFGLWPLGVEARAWLMTSGDPAIDTLATEAESRGYLALAQSIRARTGSNDLDSRD